ncbi:hypothetical protein K0M31_018190 [Melipona bicolor]|uniref:Uncharacterized protein n=1 Tax=Melipona bicolor TaxID=60889 RepID=A0AA40KE26_9HYME|nr:hypothetical protein K0M31_018190 [Melipona bicolor]
MSANGCARNEIKLRNLDNRENKDAAVIKGGTEDRENRAETELLYPLSPQSRMKIQRNQDRVQDVTGNLISSQRLPLRCDAGYQSENYVCRKQNSLSRERSSAKSAQRDAAEYFPSFSELARAGFSYLNNRNPKFY